MKRILLSVIVMMVSFAAMANEDSLLSWDPVANASEYHPQRKFETCVLPDTAPWVDLAVVPAGTVTYIDPNVAEGSVVCYRVSASALNRVAESGWSNRAEKTVPFETRNAPANFRVQ